MGVRTVNKHRSRRAAVTGFRCDPRGTHAVGPLSKHSLKGPSPPLMWAGLPVQRPWQSPPSTLTSICKCASKTATRDCCFQSPSERRHDAPSIQPAGPKIVTNPIPTSITRHSGKGSSVARKTPIRAASKSSLRVPYSSICSARRPMSSANSNGRSSISNHRIIESDGIIICVQSTSTTISISTAMSKGSSDIPTAERA